MAILLFAASLTPSLVPRTSLTQGLVSGLSIAAGYGVGVFVQWLWLFLEAPVPRGQKGRMIRLSAALGCAGIAAFSLVKATGGQNELRGLFGLAPIDPTYLLGAILVALLVFALLLALARLFRIAMLALAARVERRLPRRLAGFIGLVLAGGIAWAILSGLVVNQALRSMNAHYAALDRRIEPEFARPADPMKAGSDASLLAWNDLGRRGREFVASSPVRAEISAFLGREAIEPIRVYVGLGAADSAVARARLALDELERVGGFERRALVLVTPTGTGWIDPAAIESIEYLHGGDVASVAVQYSYVASWQNQVLRTDYGMDAARALFDQVYAYWRTLPRDARPRLYLHGLSLGAKSSIESAHPTELSSDPPSGALWSGPPYSTPLWRHVTERRDPASPAWLPRFRDGSVVRFMNQGGDAARQAGLRNAAWGPMRMVFLQYASDAVTFFDFSLLYREPDWMRPPRGPDVSPRLRWFPIVTFIQLMVDMPAAMAAPPGRGHVYSPADYVAAWIEVSEPAGWTAAEIARLQAHLLARARPIGPTME